MFDYHYLVHFTVSYRGKPDTFSISYWHTISILCEWAGCQNLTRLKFLVRTPEQNNDGPTESQQQWKAAEYSENNIIWPSSN
jgi:hypothetical protein